MNVDPVTLEVFRHEVASIAEEMGVALRRTARSVATRESGDFSTALADEKGRLIAQGLANGIHIGYVSSVMPTVLGAEVGPLESGDVVICNDPYSGLSHLVDFVVVVPAFVDDELVGFSATVCHHSDIGGRTAGGMGADARELFEEGVRFPGVKLNSRGVRNRALMQVLAANSRWPEELVGDLEAQVAAGLRGAEALARAVVSYGRERFSTLVDKLCATSEALVRASISELPDGVYGAVDDFELDGDGIETVHLAVTVTIDGDSVVVDFEGTGPQVANATNCPAGIARALTYCAFRGITGPGVPVSEGLTAPIEVRLPPSTFVNPTFPAAVGARGMGIFRLLDLLYRALADCAPQRMFAGGEGGVYTMVYVPRDRRTGMLFDLYSGGWGARAEADGVDGVSPLLMGGMAKSMPAEIIEREFPVVLEGFGLVPDSAGAGKYRGCLSVYRRWRFEAPGRVQIRRNRLTTPPYGLNGGEPGRIGPLTLEHDGVVSALPARVTIEVDVEPGDRIEYVLPSGGGYGDPHERDASAVLDDVREGKCSVAAARDIHHVAVDAASWIATRIDA